MPFQAIPIAIRKNTGDPLSKLVLIWLTAQCEIKDGCGFVYADEEDIARFAQCKPAEVLAALERLITLQLIRPSLLNQNSPEDRLLFLDVALPVSGSPLSERKRIKATPDQVELIAERDGGYSCAACGACDEANGSWHVDHIIPRSIGGADVEENIQLLCPRCNSRKGPKIHWLDFLS